MMYLHQAPVQRLAVPVALSVETRLPPQRGEGIPKGARYASAARSSNKQRYSLGLHQKYGATSSVTNSPGACVSLWV